MYATTNVTAGGNVDANNVNVTTTVSAGGDVVGGNLLATTDISAGGNVEANAILALNSGAISTGGNVYGANVLATVVSASGNVTANNVSVGNIVSATGNIVTSNYFVGDGYYISNINAANVSATKITNGGSYANVIASDGNVVIAVGAGSNIVATFYDTGVSVAGNIQTNAFVLGANLSLSGNVDGALNVGGNVTGSNLISVTNVTAGGNVLGGNLLATTDVSAGGNVEANAVLVFNSGAISTGGNVYGANVLATTVSASGIVIGGNVTTGGQISATGNVTVNSFVYIDPVDSTVLIGNSTIVACSVLSLNTTTSFVVPVGNTVQRPTSTYTGMVRFNTSQNNLEIYDNSQWTPVGSTAFTVIADQQFDGDGANVNFTLSSTQTTNSCIVSINGVVQIPTLAYAVSGTYPTCVLTFTEAPAAGDVIDVRQITTTVTLTELTSTSGNATVSVSNTSAEVDIVGNLVTTVNSSAPTLSVNKTLSFQLVSDTSLKILVRGSDGTTRSATLTLS